MSLLSRNRPSDDLPELDAGALAELDALDAALAGDEITDDALAALVRDVRSAAPEMRPEATQHLNERVAARFGMPGAAAGARAGLRGRFSRPGLAAAAGLVAVAMVTTVGVIALQSQSQPMGLDTSGDTMLAVPASPSSSTEGSTSSASSDTAASAVPPASVAEGTGVTGAGTPTAASADSRESSKSAGAGATSDSAASSTSERSPSLRPEARSTNRAVERSVDLQVRVKNGELQDAAGKVARITRDANGYVATSDLSLGSKGTGSATFTLRVDSTKLDRAIDRLSGLGTVTAQNESSRDITSAVDSAQGRLDDANQVRKALLRALAKADSDGEIASLRLRLAENRRLRASLDAQLQQVQRRADLTTIEFTLTAPAKGDPAADDGNWSLGDALSDAWSVLRTVLGGLLVGAAFAAPFALLAALGWVGFRIRRRRARERALDV